MIAGYLRLPTYSENGHCSSDCNDVYCSKCMNLFITTQRFTTAKEERFIYVMKIFSKH